MICFFVHFVDVFFLPNVQEAHMSGTNRSNGSGPLEIYRLDTAVPPVSGRHPEIVAETYFAILPQSWGNK
jgi:hypothetical protein